MAVVPVVDAELVELAELLVLELDELLELELQAATISIAATPAAVADVTRREPAPMRLRSVMKPPGALSGLAERAGAGCGVAPGVPCVTKNRSDVYACQWPEIP
jgi:hypothetical protein